MRLCRSVDVDTRASRGRPHHQQVQVQSLGLQLRRPANDAPIDRGLVVDAVSSSSGAIRITAGYLLVSVNRQSVDRMRFSDVLELLTTTPKPLRIAFVANRLTTEQQSAVEASHSESRIDSSTFNEAEAVDIDNQNGELNTRDRLDSVNEVTRRSRESIPRLSVSVLPPMVQAASKPDASPQVPELPDNRNPRRSTPAIDLMANLRWRAAVEGLVTENRRETIHQGGMFMENRQSRQKWRFFYFVLTPFKIECFLSGSTATLWDEMDIVDQHFSVCSNDGNQDEIGSQLTNKYLLELQNRDQKWVLACLSASEKQQWLKQLKRAERYPKFAHLTERRSTSTTLTKKERRLSRATISGDSVTRRPRFSYSHLSKLFVNVMSASGLVNPGSKVTINAVCEIKLGAQMFRTGVVRGECSPQWKQNNTAVFIASNESMAVDIRILDEKFPGSLHLIAKLKIPLRSLPNLEEVEQEYPLELRNGASCASLKLTLKYVKTVSQLDYHSRQALKKIEAAAVHNFSLKMNKEADTTDEELNKTLGLCSQMNEAENMAKGIHERLSNLYLLMPKRHVKESVWQPKEFDQQATFDRLFWRFRTCLEDFSGKNMLIRLIVNQAILDKLHSIHVELDELVSGSKLMVPERVHNWEIQWKGDLQAHQAFIEDAWEHRDRLLDQFRDEDTIADALKLLVFESEDQKHKSQLIQDIFLYVLQSSKQSIQSVFKWFIPRHEVDFDMKAAFASGSFGSVHHGLWIGMPVAVKLVRQFNRESFQNEADIWYKLQHGHIVRLFGACDVDKPFFVSEYASNGTLTNYLYHNKRAIWTKLHEASLGLFYLHIKLRIVHGDLKCNNILVTADGTAKINDFGTSFEINQPPAPRKLQFLGAIAWKAPELLREETAGTFASDIYAFGMCILEALNGGKNPWGKKHPIAVIYSVLEGELPNRPDGMSDFQWEFVKLMIDKDASQRIGIKLVVQALFKIKEKEEELANHRYRIKRAAKRSQ